MNNLPVPSPVRPYCFHRTYAGTLLGFHLLALLALFPYCFSQFGCVVCLLGIHVFGQGITIGYHRLLTHRSFKTPVWVERCFALLGLCCMQDTPARWVATHRMHHAHSDEIPDPHTPRVHFWWSHIGWLLFINRQTQGIGNLEKYAKDLLRDPFYMRLETKPLLHFACVLMQVPVFFALGWSSSWIWEDSFVKAWQLGCSLVVWGVFLRIVCVWHITWSVNSLSHMFGYRNYETSEGSRNNWLVALLTVGEGWHNNHHEDPTTACLQHRWWEIDVSYYEIRLLALLGLASDIVPIHKS